MVRFSLSFWMPAFAGMTEDVPCHTVTKPYWLSPPSIPKRTTLRGYLRRSETNPPPEVLMALEYRRQHG